MAQHPDYPRTRLFIETPLAAGVQTEAGEKQSHYLSKVLRLKSGDAVALFNGRDGEWLARLAEGGSKKSALLVVERQLRPQRGSADLWLLCAPLKNAKTEWVIEKAVELGVSRICPVLTKHTVAGRVNESRFGAIALEAAEQCERMEVPAIDPLMPLEKLLAEWPRDRLLIYGDESGKAGNASELVTTLAPPLALLIGPEGGFSPGELELLRSLPYVNGMCLGPRVLRADTAAIAGLALLQAFGGDWKDKPAFRS